MSDVFYEMSKVTIKPVVNYTVLQIFLISSLNFTLVVAFCTVAGNISHTFTPRTLGLFKWIAYLYLVPSLIFSNLRPVPTRATHSRPMGVGRFPSGNSHPLTQSVVKY